MKAFRFGATIGLILCSFLPGLTYAQTTVVSDGVSVRNSNPENVFFLFPTGPLQNVTAIQLGCSGSSVNPNYIFVYELQPDGFIHTYPFHVTVTCNTHDSNPGHPDDIFSGSLVNSITVQTSDHTITINTAVWIAALKSSRSGYYWSATSGQSQITVQ